MNWGNQCHNRKHMSKRYHMTKAHYQADSAPLKGARKRKQALIDKAKAKELSARGNKNQKSHHQEGD